MKYMYSPAQIDAIESLIESPYCSLFGCHGIEMAAASVVRWLAANGNRWDLQLHELNTIAREYDLLHSHNYLDGDDDLGAIKCDFAARYTAGGSVTDDFIKTVHRRTDGTRLSHATLNTLRPDLFPEPINAR